MASRLKRSYLRFMRTAALFSLASAAGLIATRVASAQEAKPPPGSPSLARYFSSRDLVVYVEFDGLDHHDAAWKKTAAYRLLKETTTGAMYEAMLPRVFQAILTTQSDISFNGQELT